MGGEQAQYDINGNITNQRQYRDPNSGQMRNVFSPNTGDYARSQMMPALADASRDTAAFKVQAQAGANKIGTDFNKFVPTLNTNFSARPGLDQFSRGLLAEGQQQVARNLGATQAQIARTVQGPAGNVLQNQAAMQARVNSNPLLFSVASQQVGRQQQEAQLGNQALLAQQGAYNTGQSASNAAITQQVGLQGLPVAAQQNLVSLLQATKSKG